MNGNWTEETQKGFEQAARKNGLFPTIQKPNNVRKRESERHELPEESGPVVDYQMKRFFAAGGFVAACVCFMFAAKNGALDGLMNVAGWCVFAIFILGFVHGALQKN